MNHKPKYGVVGDVLELWQINAPPRVFWSLVAKSRREPCGSTRHVGRPLAMLERIRVLDGMHPVQAAHKPGLVRVGAPRRRKAAPEPREPVHPGVPARLGAVRARKRREGDEAPARDGRGARDAGDREHQVHDRVQVQQEQDRDGEVGEEGDHEVDQAWPRTAQRRKAKGNRRWRGACLPCWKIIFQRLLRPGTRYNPAMVRIITIRSVNMAGGDGHSGSRHVNAGRRPSMLTVQVDHIKPNWADLLDDAPIGNRVVSRADGGYSLLKYRTALST